MADIQEQFVVTARKWRPMQFHEMVGQDHVATTLRNAVTGGRVHHAYLFTGPRGVGKTTTARLLAKSLNCFQPAPDGEPCNICDSCKDIVDGRSLDVVEIDGASNNSVDDVRKLRDNAKYPPIHGKYKVYIIDEVHMLSTSAFNALLKTLEEPPPHLLFIFATTEVHKVPATILSRCQRFDFRRMDIDTIVKQLEKIAAGEGIIIDKESLLAIAKKADGSMRDSQSIFDQVVAFCGKDVRSDAVHNALHLIDEEFFFSITHAIYHRDVATMFRLAQMVNEKGYEVQECLNGLLEHLRNMLSVLATGSTKLIESATVYLDRYEREAVHFSQPDIIRLMTLVTTTQQEIRFSTQPRFRFELMLSQMAMMDSAVLLSELLEELKKNTHHNADTVPIAERQTVKEHTPPKYSAAAIASPVQTGQVKAAKEIEPTPILKKVTAETIQQQWTTFVDTIKDAGVKMLFQFQHKDILMTFADDAITLVPKQRLAYTTLEKYVPSLEEQVRDFYEQSIKIILMSNDAHKEQEMFAIPDSAIYTDTAKNTTFVAEPKPTLSATEKLSSLLADKSNEKPQKVQREYHPLEQAAVSLFGAREVPV
ncbi:MAG TPA: DNA polymerase III subunit gamma/tau [Candidatus Kapabacteria bacterium]|nr:DNA polymerase III subunit gamma/tau [Candidatus Kapabacteria bacterium]